MANTNNNEVSDLESVPKWAKDALDVNHEAYEPLKGEYISDINCSVTYYKHKTGLKVVAIIADPDEIESSFQIVFPTYPSCDGGHAHIVEHSLLGGSKLYPTKKQFSQMLQRGIFTFINAFTYNDCTTYLFATTNDISFFKTAHYLLDGTFRPKLVTDTNILKQEAWHLVVQPVDGEASSQCKKYEFIHHGKKFSFSGIVYNEMKKKLSTITSRIHFKILNTLHTNAYKYEYGGEPNSISGLSYDSLVSFYKKFYNLPNSTIYIYTPRSIYDKLAFIDQFISQLANPPLDKVPTCTFPEEYRDEHIKIKHPYDPVGSVGDILVTAWLIDPICETTGKTFLNYTERIAFHVLDYLLTRTDASLFHKVLIPYGTNLYPGYFDATHQQAIFILGIQGFNPNNLPSKSNDDYISEFTNIIDSALEEKLRKGFTSSELLAAINSVEFQRREYGYIQLRHRDIGFYHLPRGLRLTRVMHNQDVFGKDGIEGLKFSEICQYLRSQVDTGYFEGLLRDKILKNNHRVTVHAYPSEEYTIANDKAFFDRIKTFVEKFTKDEVEQLYEDYLEFKRESDDSALDLDKLDLSERNMIPRYVELNDLPKLPIEIPCKIKLLSDDKIQDFVMGKSGIPLVIQNVSSYGILYMDLAYSLRNINLSELQQLKILTNSWRNSVSDEFEEQICTHLGGLTIEIQLDIPFNNAHSNIPTKGKYSNKNNSCGYLIIRSKFLAHNMAKAIDIVKKFFDVKVDINKHKQVVSKLINHMTLDFHDSADMYNQLLLDSCYTPVGYAKEYIGGYNFLKYLQSFVDPNPSEFDQILENILKPENLIISVTGSSAEDHVSANLNPLLSIHRLNDCTKAFDPTSVWANEILGKMANNFLACAISIPSINNFVGLGGPVFNESDDIGSNLPIAHYLHRDLLWHIIREKGGAYGVRINITQSGNLYITSFADPKILSTCETFNNLAQLIRDEVAQMTPGDFDKLKIGAISKLDIVLTPSQKGLTGLMRYVTGKTYDVDLEIRNAVFNATLDDLTKFADRFEKAKDEFGLVIIGNKGQILEQTQGIEKIFNRKLDLLDLNK